MSRITNCLKIMPPIKINTILCRNSIGAEMVDKYLNTTNSVIDVSTNWEAWCSENVVDKIIQNWKIFQNVIAIELFPKFLIQILISINN